MKLLELTRYELKWRLREPLTFCFILSPVVIGVLTVFGFLPERLMDFYGSFLTPAESQFTVISQVSLFVWLALTVSFMMKNYRERALFLSLPANRMQQWTSKVLSSFIISAFYFLNLTLVMYFVNVIGAQEIAISPLRLLLTYLSSGGVLMIFLTLSTFVKNRFLFAGLSFFVILAPVAIKEISKYHIGNFLLFYPFNLNNIPDSVASFFQYCLPVYYVLFFLMGYFGYRNMKRSHEI